MKSGSGGRPAPGDPPAITEREWLERYGQQFIRVLGISKKLADECVMAEDFGVLSEGYEDDPEGAADMEMSYWDE